MVSFLSLEAAGMNNRIVFSATPAYARVGGRFDFF